MVKSALVAALLAAGLHAQTPADDRIAALEARITALEAKLAALTTAAPPSPPPAPERVAPTIIAPADPETRLPVAGYMDFHLNKDRGQPFRPDFHRFVLLFGHSFSDRIKFWSEVEIEHALVEGGEETGELAVEQAYLDFLIKPAFNLRAGMVLTPIGIVNERHEPPSFNGVERPFVETLIIPTTWRELGIGATGDLGRGFRYRAYLLSALDARRFDAEFGISGAKTNGFEASFRNPAKAARLEYAGVRRMLIGASLYTGRAGFTLPGLNPNVTIADLDGRLSRGRFDLRGLIVNTWVTRAADLNRRLAFQTGVNPNVASEMRGWYVEPAFHLFPRRARADVIAFTRYERYNTQHRMPAGYVPLGQFDRSSWVTGLTYKPHADVAIKFDYNFNRNRSTVVRPVDGVNFGIGWWF